MGRGRRSAPGRRTGVGADSGAGGDDDDEEDTGTSVDDLTSEADPGTFDTTFTDDDADLNIQGRFDPTPGPKQVIPRLAYVLNYNLIYNPDRDRWEPDTGNEEAGGAGLTVVGVGEESVNGGGGSTTVSTGLTDGNLNGDTLDVGIALQDGATNNALPYSSDDQPSGQTDVSYSIVYFASAPEWRVVVFNNTSNQLDLRIVVYRRSVPDNPDSLSTT